MVDSPPAAEPGELAHGVGTVPFTIQGIRRRLNRVIFGTTLVALSLAAIVFAVYEFGSSRRALVHEVSILADAIGHISQAAIQFDDPNAAAQALEALTAEPSVLSATMFAADGREMAFYGEVGAAGRLASPIARNYERFQGGLLHLERLIVFDGDTIGSIHIRADTRDVYARLSALIGIVTAVLIAAALIARLLSMGLQRAIEARLIAEATLDGLTGLPNRVLAADRLSAALVRARRHQHTTSLLFIDLDQFKLVNDTLGHAAGDQLLIHVASRLVTCVRESDTVARLGGDEFVIVLAEIDDPGHPDVVARRILEALKDPIRLCGREIFVTASLGIASSPADGEDPETLFRNADAAMYQAKEAGRNQYRFFSPKLNLQAAQRLEMESDLRRALERDELVLYYQPLVDATTEAIVGVEALLRWHRPGVGLVAPAEFVPLAEETGLIIPIGQWVLENACRTVMAWQNRTGIRLRASVNVSYRQIKAADIVEVVRGALEKSGLPPDCLELEITERLLLEDLDATSVVLNHLAGMGVRLAVDDFGTGYSALSYLKDFRFDTLKIAHTFMSGVPGDTRHASLVEAIVKMAHALDLEVIGEGVESEEQKHFLRLHGCDLLQGFLFSRPVPPEHLLKLLEAQMGESSRLSSAVGGG